VWARPALVRVLAHSCLIKSANTETETVNPQISPMDEGVVRYRSGNCGLLRWLVETC
jgi:hypothetical protein